MTDKRHMTLPNGDKLYEGDYGLNRDGRKVGPMKLYSHNALYNWMCGERLTYTPLGRYQIAENCHSRDIIAKWTEAPAQSETGTLAELNVKPGDVVEYLGDGDEKDGWGYPAHEPVQRIQKDGSWFGVWAEFIHELKGQFRVVSRAGQPDQFKRSPEAPKLWRDMTPEEKGALLLAHYEGKVIEWFNVDYWEIDEDFEPEFYLAYRIRPEPKRETVAICYRAPHGQWREIGTIDLIDGKPVIDSVKIEVGDA